MRFCSLRGAVFVQVRESSCVFGASAVQSLSKLGDPHAFLEPPRCGVRPSWVVLMRFWSLRGGVFVQVRDSCRRTAGTWPAIRRTLLEKTECDRRGSRARRSPVRILPPARQFGCWLARSDGLKRAARRKPGSSLVRSITAREVFARPRPRGVT